MFQLGQTHSFGHVAVVRDQYCAVVLVFPSVVQQVYGEVDICFFLFYADHFHYLSVFNGIRKGIPCRFCKETSQMNFDFLRVIVLERVKI